MQATATLTPGRQIGSGPASAIKAVASKKAAPVVAAPAPHAAIQGAAKRATGAFSGALNNNADQEARAHAVASRRQADADKYAAFVMGQQGAVAAAAQRQDRQTLALDGATQAATLNSQLKLQQGLGAGRAQQGIGGPVPLQQSAGLVNDQQAGQALMGAVTQQQADKTNTNAGKAGFLQAAAQAGLMANKRAIAGDEYNQVSDIQRERTGLLTQRTESLKADKRAAAQTEASNAAAQLAHDDRVAALEQQSTLASDARNNSNLQLDARLRETARQGHANRVVRLKTAATTAAAGGFVTPAEQRRRNQALNGPKGVDTLRTKAEDSLKQFQAVLAPKGKWTPDHAKAVLDSEIPGLPPEVRDYVLAAAFGRKAGVTKKGQPSAAARYTTLVNKIKRGEL